MADGDKTEAPSEKKRQDARKEGNVFQSADIVTVVVLFGVFYAVRFMIPFIYKDLRNFLSFILELIQEREPVSSQIYYRFLWLLVKSALPLLLITMFLGTISSLVQTRFNISFKLVVPKFSKLSPARGFTKVFSKRNLVDLIKNIIKIVLLINFLYSILKADIIPIAKMLHMDIRNSSIALMSMMFDLITRVCGVFLIIAIFDFMYQKWQYESDLKMTKQEVKDEYKQNEGNPEIKGRIRQLMRSKANQRMMQYVPDADVIIRNPEHLAIAIKYDPDKNQAPVVLAKGQDELALKIIEVGEEHQITAVENRPLARAMYPLCKVGQEIPGDFYGAVAEILVYIYRKENRQDILDRAKEDNRNA